MPSRSLALVSSLALAAGFGCSSTSYGPSDGGAPSSDARSDDGTDGGASVQAGDLPCDVDAVLAANCRTCHGATPSFGAPMPLVTWSDLTASARSQPQKKVYELVGQRIHDDASPMPQPPNPRLSAADAATLDAWIAAGATAARAASGSCAPAKTDGGTSALSCTPDVHIGPGSAWSMPQDLADQYVCYGMDVTTTAKRHIVAMAPRVDNTRIVHHIVVVQMDTAQPTAPTPCSSGSISTGKIVYVWAPGGQNLELPSAAGFPEEGTTHYMVQVHYNNVAQLAGQTDTSGADFCTTDQLRPNDADVMAFGSTNFTIPAHGTLDMDCDVNIPSGFPALHAFGAMPHMHQLGTVISTQQRPSGGGAAVDLGSDAPWNFQSQAWLGIDATLHPGDTIRTRCAWNNPTASPVSFGQNTEDEMCFSFTMYYPKIEAPDWSWGAPTAVSQCAPHP